LIDKKMKRKPITLFLIILINALILNGCAMEPPRPEGAFKSAELLAEPVYNTPIQVYGQVQGLGEFECPCFALKSGDEQIYVWFDMMVERDGSPTPPTLTPVDVEGIENDDWIVVTGELKFFEGFKVHKDFWLDDYKIIQKYK
jgi:hypothetical protein